MVDLSIIVPIHNGALTIKRLTDSIISKIEISYEIILVENNSSDNSYEICESIRRDNPTVSITAIQSSATSVGAALNEGLENANAKYIHFVDADDEVYAQNYKKIIQRMKTQQIMLLQLNYTIYDDEKKKYTGIKGGKAFNNSYWNKIYDFKLIKENQIKFLDGILNQDGNFNGEIRSTLPNIVYSDEVIYKYYINIEGGSVSDNVTIKTLKGFYDNYFSENKLVLYNKISINHSRYHQFYRFFAYKTNDANYEECYKMFTELAKNIFLTIPIKTDNFYINKSYAYVMYVALLNDDYATVKTLQQNHRVFLKDLGTENQRVYLQMLDKSTKDILLNREKEIIKNIEQISNKEVKLLLEKFLEVIIRKNKHYNKIQKRIILHLVKTKKYKIVKKVI